MIVAVGFCLFDTTHATDTDLCACLIVAALALPLASTLAATGRFVPVLTPLSDRYPPDLPSPPPKA